MNLFYSDKIISVLSNHFSIWLGMTAFFTVVAWVFPAARGQKVFRKDYLTDLGLFFAGGIFYPLASAAMVVTVITVVGLFVGQDAVIHYTKSGNPYVQMLPLWAQGLLYFVVSDFIMYWLHRAYHHAPLWRWHKLHHSATEMDWLTMARFHPFNVLLYSTFVAVLMYFVGFSLELIAYTAPLNVFYSAFVHANWELEFPKPLNYLLASPTFHRWHHTHQKEGGNKNFAPTFPIFDVLFGTYYQPAAGTKPTTLGLDQPEKSVWW